jgi:hypothetical protein
MDAENAASFGDGGYGIAPAPAQVTETLLHSFTSPPKGANLYAGLLRDAARETHGAV